MRRMFSETQLKGIINNEIDNKALHLYAVKHEFLDSDVTIGELEIKLLTNKELVAGELTIEDLDNIVDIQFYNKTGEDFATLNYPLFYNLTASGIHLDTLINDTSAETFTKGTITISLTNINTYDLVKIF